MEPTTELTAEQVDRARGAVLASAVGDALGAPYEAGLAVLTPAGPQMIGGGIGGFAPGEWTDDTSMAWAVLDVAAAGLDLRGEPGLTRIARNFRDWFDTDPPDVGHQTRRVLSAGGPGPTGAGLTTAAAELQAATGHTGGNGSLMRTAAVALPYLDDQPCPDDQTRLDDQTQLDQRVVAAARAVNDLTHADERAGQACVLWSLAIRHAILHGEFDLRAGSAALGDAAAAWWSKRITEAETRPPGSFAPNGYVVSAFQAAWAAITQTPVPTSRPGDHLRDALVTAIAIGDDTDTVAAIAGALLGARWGAAAVPGPWREIVHGYPGRTGEDLVALAEAAVGAGGPDGPADPGHGE